ncbi:hypothetical protein BASA50_003885 [Batrachochytrium salamandrivorans]|uniref:Uncharacterized protein n=1 Tax=Batrachochytrium salamandrivorans TaxID=1357716 RepID=A0ABQ8FHB2_9FUNG|nr:hypothetical protein BASA62_009545 [Batrachochytrium salamandrivorans]KAH6582817.1 hypothetical protein BASA60_001713 [Batrachochytrium salamandrivorans]KAH6598271.1 hypothetical protein BASA50_003885 [Batrachochytrium salamandrivorans]KAH9266002.1 hypothetical protein BASA84_001346 [Batrachochytrium salamandrivorans]KAJ1341035.1 hypothetical protein BSLG_004505 [Batrachochytrium salamandrivorans]
MKLAIASTTLLFAMMAAQATVLSVAPVTGVNLVKRAPNGGEDDEQSAMASQSSSGPTFQDPLTEKEEEQMNDLYDTLRRELGELTRSYYFLSDSISEYKTLAEELEDACEGETSPACTKVGAVVDKLKEKIANLEEQLKMNKEEYQPRLDKEIALKEAMRLDDYSYLRTYLSSQ